MKKKIIYILVILTLIFHNTIFASSVVFPEDRGILLYEEKSESFLYEQNASKKFYPASTTKIMTALLVLENMELDDKITVGDEITLISSDSSKADLKQGEEFTVKELLHGLLVVSGNDVAYTFAKVVGSKVGGVQDSEISIQTFVEMMNARALQLGAVDTHFMNPHGLHHENHYSTPKDILILTKELLKYDIAKEIVSTPTYMVMTNLSTHKWASTNVYLHKNWSSVPYVWSKGPNPYYTSDVKGIKTGSTTPAGKCIVFSAEKEDMDLIGVIFHSTFEEIWKEGIMLMNFAVQNYEYKNVIKIDEVVDHLTISNPSDTSPTDLSVITKANIPLLLEKEDIEEIQESKTIDYDVKRIELLQDNTIKLKKDVKAGELIGKLVYSLEGKVIAESEVYAAHDVEKIGVLDFLFHWQIILLSIVFLIFIIRRYNRKKNRRRKKKRRKVTRRKI